MRRGSHIASAGRFTKRCDAARGGRSGGLSCDAKDAGRLPAIDSGSCRGKGRKEGSPGGAQDQSQDSPPDLPPRAAPQRLKAYRIVQSNLQVT